MSTSQNNISPKLKATQTFNDLEGEFFNEEISCRLIHFWEARNHTRGNILMGLELLLTNTTISKIQVEVSESDMETIIEKDDKCKVKDDATLKNVAGELVALGYDAAICKSCWEKSKSKSCHDPAEEYEYLDVIIGKERVLIDIDFQSNFEIARPTKTYKSISHTLPYVFVGQVDRLKKIVIFVSKAAKKSLKKKGLNMPPWRKAEYVLTKWVAQYDRAKQTQGETSGEDGHVQP